MTRLFEALLGMVFLVAAGVFLTYAIQFAEFVDELSTPRYPLKVSFSRGEGIVKGVPVRISGIGVGMVESVALDPEFFVANVILMVDHDISLATDTQAKLSSSLLTNDAAIELIPGNLADKLKPGDVIKNVEESVSLEDLIGKFINGS